MEKFSLGNTKAKADDPLCVLCQTEMQWSPSLQASASPAVTQGGFLNQEVSLAQNSNSKSDVFGFPGLSVLAVLVLAISGKSAREESVVGPVTSLGTSEKSVVLTPVSVSCGCPETCYGRTRPSLAR